MKIAVAGQHGSTTNAHFGYADFFRIFDISDEQPRLLETRANTGHCTSAGANRLQLSQSVAMLADCTALLAAKIGPCARQALLTYDIIPLEYDGHGLDGSEGTLERLKRRLGT